MKSKLIRVLTLSLAFAIPVLMTAQEIKKQVVPPGPDTYAPEQSSADDFTDEEITKFSNIVESITALQAEAQEKMVEVIEAEGMDLDAYNRVAQAHQGPDQGASVSDAEREKFAKVNEKMQEIQVEMQPRLVEAVEDQELEVERYQKMLQVYQQNPNFQQKVQEEMQN